MNVLPVTQEILCGYVSYLGERGLKHSTIKNYLSSLRYLQICYGFPSPFESAMPKLELVMRGIKRAQGKLGLTPRRKLPITPIILRQVRAVWSRSGQDFEETMLWAAAVTCFFGFLRAGEITVLRKGDFDPSYHLSLEDLATDSVIDPSFVQLTLKASKTDPFRQGVTITIGRTDEVLCPVSALFDYVRLRGGAKGPLFIRPDGTPLTRSYFITKVREALGSIGHRNVSDYAGHSFRAGAATTAAAVGVEDSLIKTLGRYESSAYLLYIRIPREELSYVSKSLKIWF